MTPEQLAARLEIEDLLAAYTRFGDTGRFEEMTALFAPDAVFDVAGDVFVGHAQIRGFFDATTERFATITGLLPGGHHVSSRWIELTGETAAASGARFLFVGVEGPDHWGTYRDQVAVVDGAWRIAVRRVRVDGYSPTSRLRP